MSDDFDRAIARARVHFGNATREALAAVIAVLEAGGRVSGLDPEQTERLAASFARRFEAQIERLKDGALLPEAILVPLEEALAREITRWEERSKHDPDARAVLRAFLGLRELLWELGLRGETKEGSEREQTDERTRRSTRPKPAASTGRERLQRFEVED